MLTAEPQSSPAPDGEISLDVAIVGAGPAGGAAAIELSGRGLRVGVIEKASPPRYKTCGGGVLWRAVKLLPVELAGVVERECRSVELVHHDPHLQFLCQRSHPIVCMVMRDRFDHLLLTHALARGGVDLFPDTAVTGVVAGDKEIVLETTRGRFRARFVVAADGVNSTIARKTDRPELRGIFPALECEVAMPDTAMEPWLGTARFDFGLIPAGYGWVFPKRGHLSIGVGTTRRGAVNLPGAYRRYYDRLGLPAPLREERHGYMIPCQPRERLFSVPRVLFVGDAAGLADPVTAEGITAGILSGQLAARAITGGNLADRDVRTRYEASLRAELLGDLRVARRLAWVLYERPRWCAALLARHGSGMSELMTRIVTGETTYRAAVSRPAHYLRLLVGSAAPGA